MYWNTTLMYIELHRRGRVECGYDKLSFRFTESVVCFDVRIPPNRFLNRALADYSGQSSTDPGDKECPQRDRRLQSYFEDRQSTLEQNGTTNVKRVNAKKDTARGSAADYCKGLDNSLRLTVACKLSDFASRGVELRQLEPGTVRWRNKKTGRIVQHRPGEKPKFELEVDVLTQPIIVMTQDEGSNGLAAANYMGSVACGMNLVWRRDPPHRDWNDAKAALKETGLWQSVLKATLAFNANYGPFMGAGFNQEKVEAWKEYLNGLKRNDPDKWQLFAEHETFIMEDFGKSKNSVERALILERLSTAKNLSGKGDYCSMKRWFSFWDAADKFLPDWTLMLVILKFLLIETGREAGMQGIMARMARKAVELEEKKKPDDKQSTNMMGTEREEQIRVKELEVKEMRQVCKSTLTLATVILQDEKVRKDIQMIVHIIQPLRKEHGQNIKKTENSSRS